tara:strand:- start:11766 stop:12017 length:252 start_codon:yes stop_codon:yes gene_type:complete
MSRFRIDIDNNTHIHYGFDNQGWPGPYYFWEMWSSPTGREDDWREMSDCFEGNKTGLLQKMEEVGVDLFPEEHVTKVAMDLPI